MKSKSLTLAFVILGAFIGAGFCSGKEVIAYFAIYGYYAIPMCLICGVMFFVLMRIFLLAGAYFNTKQFGSLNVINIIATMIIISSMIAGSISIADTCLVSFVVYIITMLVTLVVCLGGVSRLDRFNHYLVPVIIIVLLVTCIISWGSLSEFSMPSSHNPILYICGSMGSCINYICLNLLLMGMFLFSVGRNYTKKQITRACLISSSIITILLLVITITLLNTNYQIFTSDMPMIQLAKYISPVLYYVVQFIVWLGLVTTLITSTHTVCEYLPTSRSNRPICIAGILGVCSIISIIGFSAIVTYLYLLVGIMGAIYTINTISFYRHNKK